MNLVFRRIAAYLLDVLLLFAVLAPLGLTVLWFLGQTPRSGPAIALTLLWNFSLPVWLYFLLSDRSARGATLGKRLLRIQVRTNRGEQVRPGRALARTAVKLLPWELTHLSAFALSTDLAALGPLQVTGIALANVLALSYLGAVIATSGRRSVHDYLAATFVQAMSVANTEDHYGRRE